MQFQLASVWMENLDFSLKNGNITFMPELRSVLNAAKYW